MSNSNLYPYMTEVMRDLFLRAKSRGLDISLESSTGMAMTIKNSSMNRVIIGADLGLNFSAANRLCSDKYFAQDLLKQGGLNVIESKLVDAHAPPLIGDVEFPCIVKPNKGAGGDGLSLVNAYPQLNVAIELARSHDSQVLIQKRLNQREFRLVVLDGQLLYAYEKRTWCIYGDGQASIADFINLYNEQVTDRQEISLRDKVLKTNLLNAGKTLSTILPQGESYELFANANLKKGATSFPVDHFDLRYIDIVVKACREMGLRYAGIDLFADQPEIFDEQYSIVEVNANPGFQFLRKDGALMRQVLDKLEVAIFDT